MIQAQARNPRQTAVVDMLLLPLPCSLTEMIVVPLYKKWPCHKNDERERRKW